MLKKINKNYRFPILMLLAIVVGSILGIVLKEKSVYLKPFGDIFLNLLYTIVVPLVFFTISSSIANMKNMKKLGKIMRSMFLVFAVTSAIAAVLMLFVIKVVNPMGDATIELVAGEVSEKLSLGTQIVKAITVPDFVNLFSRSNILPLIIFAIILGFAVNLMKEDGEKIAESLDSLSKLMMKIIGIIMYYAPIGICAYFASLIGEFGPELLGSYAKSMLIYYLLSVFYFLVFFTLYAYIGGGKKGVKRFYEKILTSVATSLATQSSLATLPSNLEAAKEIGISEDVREITLPIGVTMHMEGSSMATILKIAFLFSVFNMEFTGIGTYSLAILIAVVSSVVMSGIPGGGLIGEMFIMSVYGFPIEAFPIIATIGWLVDPPATCLNVVGDTSSSMIVSRMVDGKDWMEKTEN